MMPPLSATRRTPLAISSGSQVFHEPELQDLIRKALANNYDVRIAAQHVLEQQAQVQITRSQQFPTLSVGGTGIGADAALAQQLANSAQLAQPARRRQLQPFRCVDA